MKTKKFTYNQHKQGESLRKYFTKKWLKNGRQCEECGIRINHRQNLKRHLYLNCRASGKVVYKERKKKERIPVSCDKCGRTFKWKTSLTKHIQDLHMSEEEKLLEFYRCTLCNFRCPGETFLKVHFSRAHEVKTLSCDDCDLKYATTDTLRRHRKMKHLNVVL